MINVAVLYNLIVVVGRAVFWELDNLLPATWLLLDYACDFLYVVDTFIRMHEGVYSVDIYDCYYPCVFRISGARAVSEEASLVATELFPEPIFPNQRHQVLSFI